MTFYIAVAIAFLAFVVVIEGVALLAVMRQVGTVLMHVAPPRPGSALGGPMPGTPVVGAAADLLDLTRPSVVIFLGTNCPSCAPIERVLPVFSAHYGEDLTITTVVTGEFETRRDEHARKLGIPARHDLQELIDLWQIPGTPYAVGIADSTIVHAGVVNTLDQLEALAEAAVLGYGVESHTPVEVGSFPNEVLEGVCEPK